MPTEPSASAGRPTSKRAKSSAGAAAPSLGRARRGTSATTTSTAPSTGDPSTAAATGQPSATPRSAAAGQQASSEASPGAGSVEAAVAADLARLKVKGADGIAATALILARRIDAGMSATAFSMCAGRLIEALDRLRELAPPDEETDDLDELSARRTARLRRAGT